MVNASSGWSEREGSRREEEVKVRGTRRGTGWGKCVTAFERAGEKKKKTPKINETQPNEKKKKMSSESALGMRVTGFSPSSGDFPRC